jgi:hypothetical protein
MRLKSSWPPFCVNVGLGYVVELPGWDARSTGK